jgi:hypothetical protein
MGRKVDEVPFIRNFQNRMISNVSSRIEKLRWQ